MIQRQTLILIGIAVVIAAVPVTLYLVRQTQIFQSKAAFIPKIEFVDDTGSIITETQSPNVVLKITKEESPSPSPSPTSSPSGIST